MSAAWDSGRTTTWTPSRRWRVVTNAVSRTSEAFKPRVVATVCTNIVWFSEANVSTVKFDKPINAASPFSFPHASFPGTALYVNCGHK
eukprot:3148465-Rhodomonas_salina.1